MICIKILRGANLCKSGIEFPIYIDFFISAAHF
jgi:hypothetical protein